MRRLLLTISATLFLAISAHAAQYTLGDNGYYFDAAGIAYTRDVADYGQYRWNGCRWVWYSDYRYTYTPVKLDLAAVDFETRLLDIAKARDKAENTQRIDNQKHLQRLELIDKLGLTGNFHLNNYGIGSARYTNGLTLSHAGITGNTVYGASGSTYTYSQVADIYGGNLDLNVLYQQAASLAKGAQALSTQATSEHAGLVQQASDGAARVAQIRAEGEIAVQKLKAVAPAPSAIITTTVNGQSNVVQPAVEPNIMPRLAALPVVYNSYGCIQCHAGAQAKGGLDMTKPLTEDQKREVVNRITTKDPAKAMPRPLKDGDKAARVAWKDVPEFAK